MTSESADAGIDPGVGEADVLSREVYETLVDAAETYREALVVRLCGEVGLRPTEIARLTPDCVRRVREDPPRYVLAVPQADTRDESERDGEYPDGSDTVDRTDTGTDASDAMAGTGDGFGDATAGDDTVATGVGETDIDRNETGGVDGDHDTGGSGAIERHAYLPTAVERELRRYVRSNGIDRRERVFPVTPRRLQMLVSDVGDRASDRTADPSLASVSSSDLRRRFAHATLVEYGVNPRVVKAVGGWRSFEALETYLPAPEVDEIVASFDPVEGRSPPDRRRLDGTDDGVIRSLLGVTNRCAVFRLDRDGYVEHWTRSAATMFGYEAGDVVGTHVSAFYTDEAVSRGVPERTLAAAIDDRGSETDGWRLRQDETRFRAFEIVSPLRDERSRRVGFAVLVCDVTPYYDRLETERADRAELGRLYSVAERHRDVTAALLGSTMHEQVETGTCEALVDGEPYDVAWIDRTILSDRPRTWRTVRGVESELADRLTEVLSRAVDGDPSVEGNGHNDSSTGQAETTPVSVVREISVEHDGDRFDGDIATVTLAYGETVYGTLSVGTERPGAFDDREREWLETVARQVGYAISAIRRRNLLLSDSLLELEFVCRDDRSFFVDASARLQCRFELISLVQLSESTRLFYVHLAEAPPAEVFDLAADLEGVDDCRLIETRADGWRVEFVVTGSSPVLTLTEYGATVSEAIVDHGVSTIRAECAADVDLRTIVGGVRSAFPDSELRGKRKVERSVQTAREYRQGIEERLTDRQEAALRAAYFGGYYDWPRESTAEEIADAMGISSPTLHNHLRKGQHELLRTFFDAKAVDD